VELITYGQFTTPLLLYFFRSGTLFQLLSYPSIWPLHVLAVGGWREEGKKEGIREVIYKNCDKLQVPPLDYLQPMPFLNIGTLAYRRNSCLVVM